MKYFLGFIFLAGCGVLNERVIEDFIEGEAQVAEKIVEDIVGGPNPTNQPK